MRDMQLWMLRERVSSCSAREPLIFKMGQTSYGELSCSHAGIVNVVKNAVDVFKRPIYMVSHKLIIPFSFLLTLVRLSEVCT